MATLAHTAGQRHARALEGGRAARRASDEDMDDDAAAVRVARAPLVRGPAALVDAGVAAVAVTLPSLERPLPRDAAARHFAAMLDIPQVYTLFTSPSVRFIDARLLPYAEVNNGVCVTAVSSVAWGAGTRVTRDRVLREADTLCTLALPVTAGGVAAYATFAASLLEDAAAAGGRSVTPLRSARGLAYVRAATALPTPRSDDAMELVDAAGTAPSEVAMGDADAAPTDALATAAVTLYADVGSAAFMYRGVDDATRALVADAPDGGWAPLANMLLPPQPVLHTLLAHLTHDGVDVEFARRVSDGDDLAVLMLALVRAQPSAAFVWDAFLPLDADYLRSRLDAGLRGVVPLA